MYLVLQKEMKELTVIVLNGDSGRASSWECDISVSGGGSHSEGLWPLYTVVIIYRDADCSL